MFTQRLAGHSLASIARALNDTGVACPSGVDPDRNRHRTGEGWTLRTVAAILANPRYTGRQVWNRQRTDVNSTSSGHDQRDTTRWNPITDWVISKQQAHAALVSEQDFITTQAIRSHRTAADGATRSYLFTGLLRCAPCGRRMESHWVNQRPGYRCRHGHTSTRHPTSRRHKILYLREDHIIGRLATHSDLAETLRDPHKLVNFLRTNKIIIVCDQDACAPVRKTSAQVKP